MSRFPEIVRLAGLALLLSAAPALAAGDAAEGARVFRKCATCHAVGENARNKVGPHLNDLAGRAAGTVEGYRYSPALKGSGVVWTAESLDRYLASPRDFIKGNRMAFAGLKKQAERDDVIAYLATLGASATAGAKPADSVPAAAPAPQPAMAASTAEHGIFHLGRQATEDEIRAWDIDVRPDGTGLPEGRGTVAEGEVLFSERCAACHGDFGEGRDRWPVLAGGFDTLTAERPEKTIGSFWPYLSTVYDYVHRAMPFGEARSLSEDNVYALTAYLLYLNDIVTDESFELSKQNFTSIRLPNEANFIPDDRAEEAHYKAGAPCMTDCKPDPAKVVMRARVLDVTPDGEEDGQGGGVD